MPRSTRTRLADASSSNQQQEGETVTDESVSEQPIIKRTCAGQCGTTLNYLLAPALDLLTAPLTSKSSAFVLTCLDSVTPYKEGHLCLDCDVAVAEALACRREKRQREVAAKERAARKARVR